MLPVENGNDYGQVVAALSDDGRLGPGRPPPDDRHRQDHQGLLAGARPTAKLTPTVKQIVSYPSHPYGYKMNSDYFVALAEHVRGALRHRHSTASATGAVTNERERLIQFKTNIDKVMSVLDQNGLGDWLADRLVAIGDTVKDDRKSSPSTARAIPSWTSGCGSPIFRWSRRRSRVKNRVSGAEKEVSRHPVPQAGRERPVPAAPSPKSSNG